MKTIPSPKTSRFLQRFKWILDPVGYLEKNHQHYPDLFVAKVIGFGETMIYVSHPQALQQILTNDRKQFTAPGEMNQLLAPLLGSSSVIMLSGEEHKKRRQLVMPSFHGERMQAYGALITKLADEVMSELSIGQTFTARVAMQNVSIKVILEAVFGLYEGERYQKLKHLLTQMLDLFNSPVTSAFVFLPLLQKDLGAWSPWGRFLRQQQQIDTLLYEEIAQRRAKPDPDRTDILSLLMSAKDEEGNPLTDKQLRDELLTLLVAGHETTATAMSWGLYWIHRLPEVKEKLLQELDSLGESPDPMEIFRLPYLGAVCNETLRRSPVAMLTFPRVVQEPVDLLGYHLEPGTMVMGCMFLTHQREDLYPNPKEFKPERFLERKYSPYEFIPFGNGARRCIGDALAMFEMKLVLATVLSKYNLSLADERPEKLQRRGLTLTPARGVKMVFNGRRTAQKKVAEMAVF